MTPDRILFDTELTVRIGNVEGLQKIDFKAAEDEKANIFDQDIEKLIGIIEQIARITEREDEDDTGELPRSLEEFIKNCKTTKHGKKRLKTRNLLSDPFLADVSKDKKYF